MVAEDKEIWVKDIEGYLYLYKNKIKLKYVEKHCILDGTGYEKKTGVYFLIKNKKVVYVGKSERCIHSRILSHYGKKKFNDVYIIEITPYFANIDIAEYVYINIFNPIYNTINKNFEYKSELNKFSLWN